MKRGLLCLVLLWVLCLSGCSPAAFKEQLSVLDEMTRSSYQEIQEDRLPDFAKRFDEEALQSLSLEKLDQLQGAVAFFGALEDLTPTGFRAENHLFGDQIIHRDYNFTAENGSGVLKISAKSEDGTLYFTTWSLLDQAASEQVREKPEENVYPSAMASVIGTIISLAIWGFIVWTFVACARGNMRYKPLLFLLIWLVQLNLVIALGDGFQVHLTVQMDPFPWSALRLYEQGWSLTILAPLGAAIYWLLQALPSRRPKPRPAVQRKKPPAADKPEPEETVRGGIFVDPDKESDSSENAGQSQ